MARAWRALALTAGVTVAVALAAQIGAVAAPSPRGHAILARARHTAEGGPAVVVRAGARVRPMPRSWLGLSMEYDELPLYARTTPAFVRFLALLSVPGTGPQLVRIGGDSADQTFVPADLQAGGYALTPAWFATAGRVIREAGWRVQLDLNLLRATPRQAMDEARAERARLPAGSIAGFEVGNEPDLYHDYSAGAYISAFSAYARRLASIAPGVPVIGPALSGTNLTRWVRNLLIVDRRFVGEVSVHRYPLSNCARPGSRDYATIPRLLSPRASVDVARSAARVAAIAHAAGRPLRVDELNSVTCHGVPGVSNTFAAALWAPGALFSLLGTAVNGVNLHIRPTTVNGPLALAPGGLRPRPYMYGLVLFARSLSPVGALVEQHFALPRGVKAYAVRVPGPAYRVVLVNVGGLRRRVRVSLPVRAGAVGSVQRLLAPSLRAVSGVTLAGQHLGLDGRWHGRRRTGRLSWGRGGFWVALPAHSAALLTAGPA